MKVLKAVLISIDNENHKVVNEWSLEKGRYHNYKPIIIIGVTKLEGILKKLKLQ